MLKPHFEAIIAYYPIYYVLYKIAPLLSTVFGAFCDFYTNITKHLINS